MTAQDATRRPPPRRPFPRLRGLRTVALLLIAFGAGGAVLHYLDGPRRAAVVVLTPGPVSSVKDGAAALRGRVAEVFGDKFVLADDTGRALVETGPAGRGAALVKPGETVTAQGRFDHGSLHAAVLIHDDGHRDALDPGPDAPPPPPGPRAGP